MKKILYCLLDGYGDVPCKTLGGKTPLEAAKTPGMDARLGGGSCGLLEPMGLGKDVPISDASAMTFSFLGYDVRAFPHGRGMIEAVGTGLKILDGDFVARCNFATVDADGKILDMRAGRIRETKELEAALNGIDLGVNFEFKATAGYRGLLWFKGGRFSEKVSPVDPHEVGKKIMAATPLAPEAKETAELLNEFMREARNALAGTETNAERRKKGLPEANAILARGYSAATPKLEPFAKKFGVKPAAVTGIAVNVGICRLLGIPVIDVAEDVGDNSKEMELKKAPVLKAIDTYDFVFVHFKTIDVAGHDAKPLAKVGEIERTDAFLRGLDFQGVRAFGADHCTRSEEGRHSADLIPYLLSKQEGKPRKFSEAECARGKKIAQFDFVQAALDLAK
ncbi:hypothetical protein AUJ16_03050 [Candidatus Micrarchaeota archaeon CG1_02_60_51]|nr:MAG: hypothetical protein AUJ16_03050 [Candidatus Micrarchaeota archaeon CG1_02_60_51]